MFFSIIVCIGNVWGEKLYGLEFGSCWCYLSNILSSDPLPKFFLQEGKSICNDSMSLGIHLRFNFIQKDYLTYEAKKAFWQLINQDHGWIDNVYYFTKCDELFASFAFIIAKNGKKVFFPSVYYFNHHLPSKLSKSWKWVQKQQVKTKRNH